MLRFLNKRNEIYPAHLFLKFELPPDLAGGIKLKIT